MNRLIKDNVMVEFVELGEGLNGDYNEDDPHDVEVLRFDVFVKSDGEGDWDWNGGFEEDGVFWSAPRDSSYCTLLPVSLNEEERQRALSLIMDTIGDRPNKSSMAQATWLTVEDVRA